MKKVGSQITLAVVCAILGFMLAYQFKVLAKYNKKQNVNVNTTDITVEIEQYKKEKSDLQKKVDELQAQVKNYENAAVGKGDANKELLAQLESSRVLAGVTDVEGPGITIYLSPPTSNFGTNVTNERITERHLTYLINELRFAEAEAIAINGYRITSRTGIKSGNNNSYILVNGQKISPNSQIVITAIGDKNLMQKGLEFQNALVDFVGICDVKIEKSDKIKIEKYNKAYKFEYVKPVK